MVDFAIDPETGDHYIEGGQIAEVSDPIEESKQRISTACQTHRGEWLYDNEHGLPFREEILVKNPNLSAISSRVRAFILSLEGVIGVTECTVTFNAPARKLTIRVNAEVPEGITGPFLITVGLAP